MLHKLPAAVLDWLACCLSTASSGIMQQPPPGFRAAPTTRAMINITLKPQVPATVITSTDATNATDATDATSATNATTDVEAALPANVTSVAAALPAAEAVLNRWWYLLGVGLFVILIGER